MLNELKKLIEFIEIEYLQFNDKWKNSVYFNKVNLRKLQVKQLKNDKLMLDVVFNYREFINDNNIQLIMDFKQFNTKKAKVNTRVKAKNSIEFKIDNYINKNENGEIPVNKCLNDLFGIRMICKECLTYEEIRDFVEKEFNNLKCINSSKDSYKATHIYFKKDNFHFQWELQVWNEEDEENNIKSHEEYKQDYVRWEKESKGGNS